jgi:hypothetical protein
MNLEQRVTMLEQELQILKNQIQATLLDIQEQLLTNTYPSLRAETRPEPAPVKTISAQPAGPAKTEEQIREVAPPAHKPQLRQVSLKEMEPYQEPPAPSPAPERTPTYPSRQNAQPYGEAASIKPASAYAEPKPEANPVLRRHRADPASYHPHGDAPGPQALPFAVDDDLPPAAAAEDTPISQVDWAILEQLEEWTIRRINKFGPRRTRELIKQYAAEGHIAPPVKDSLLQLVSIITGETALQGPNGDNFAPDRKTMSHRLAPPDGAALQPPNDSDGENVSPNLILRLIAGIATLGTSNSRSKSHG